MKLNNINQILSDIEIANPCIPEPTGFANGKIIINMPSKKLQRIIKDLSQFSEFVVISCTRDGIKFSSVASGRFGNIKLGHTTDLDKEEENVTKVSFFVQFTKMHLSKKSNFHISISPS